LKTAIIAIIFLIIFSIITIQNSHEENSREKARFWGTHDMVLYGEPQIDFKVDPLTPIPYKVNAEVQIGNYKTNLFGGGYLKPDYGYYDRQCKSVQGFEYLFSEKMDFIRIDYTGKICYMGTSIKSVNLVFTGSDPKGVFENSEIGGTLSGNSDRYERTYNLNINSILVYN